MSLPARALITAALLVSNAALAQSWQAIPSGTVAELRGLSVVSDKVAWASGAKGTVLRTVDGQQWQAMQVPDADKIDFRDIQAFDAKTAIVMGAGPGAASRIYRTVDGGATWKLVTTNQVLDGFWDAMAFWDKDNGILFGDPVKGSFQVYTTADGGLTWQEVAARGIEAMPNEGAFAASGTCLTVAGSNDAWIATGGSASARVFHSSDRGKTWRASSTPIPAGAPARGVFSVAFLNSKEGFAAGGDYKETRMAGINGAYTADGGASWTPVEVAPAGYMSVVVPVPGAPRAFVAAGLAGSGYSTNGGRNWVELDRTPMNTVGFASPTQGWAVGPKGLLMKYTGPSLNK
ncbi:WD40/YVTN/BNR-like repeat-containing protein [Massilia agri]|uniref:YCF48-related protein n=1 Tax=Massilia agri TaxID=1886785 RepID=A0ABT2AGB9_9BURK|nr:YCF48-related protein [Massilia agri]MCS0595225.1 YCF48-related protein [Massilia agri]